MASKQANPGCLIPFGLIFVIAGCIPGGIAVHDVLRAKAMQQWVETPANIVTVNLDHSGEDSVRVEVTYSYRATDPAAVEAAGVRTYTSDQVGIHSGSDNIGSWHADTFARLDRARQGEQSVPCWYDPQDPTQAVLDREVRWSMVGFLCIFPLVFGLVGGVVVWAGVHGLRKRRILAADPTALAKTPVIQAEGGSGTCALWVMTVVWNAISWAVIIGIFTKDDVPWPVRLMILLFPLVGLVLVIVTLIATARFMRHGRPRLRLDQGAWLTGSRVQASILIEVGPKPGERFDTRLSVVRSVTSGSGKHRRTTDQTLWTCEVAVDPSAGRQVEGWWSLPIELPLPSDLPPTGDDLAWKLECHLVRSGPDLSTTFALPVATGDGGTVLLSGDLKAAADRAEPLAVLTKAGISVGEERGAVVLLLPAWRNPGLFIPGLIMAILLSVGAAALYDKVGWWTALLSGPIVLLCWRGALRSALWRSTIILSKGRITVTAGWWRMQRTELTGSDVLVVERTSNMSSGETAWFNMWLKTAEGQRIAIARGVPGPASARLQEMIDAVR